MIGLEIQSNEPLVEWSAVGRDHRWRSLPLMQRVEDLDSIRQIVQAVT